MWFVHRSHSIVQTQFDILGRAYKVSNPHNSTAQYWTETDYDAVGRVIATILPDGSKISTSYAPDTTVTATDPAGKKRKTQFDGIGHLTAAFEPDIANGNALTQQTSYSYDVFDNVNSVSQGVQTRTFVYDALGRLTDSTTPEAGHSQFQYDNFNLLKQRTDARGVISTYSYDNLNRPYQISYDVSHATGVQATPTVTLTYGTNATQFNNGRLITMTDGVGSENYTYNNLGEMTQVQKVIGTTTYPTSYAYNLAGQLAQITYPSTHVVQQSVDAIGRLCEIASSTTACGTATSPYATGYAYSAANQTTGVKYGNGIFASFGFSSDRLQLNCLDYSTTNRSGNCTHDSTSKFSLAYSYGALGSNNGQISGITDNSGTQEAGRSVTYTYDPLYRLSIATTTGSTGYPAWGLKETYDRYGSRSAQAVNSGCTGITCPTNSFTPDPATNRVSGDCYDLNGNLLAESAPPCPSPTYTYDAENRTVNYLSAAYTYDGNGLRVKKVSGSTTTVYVFSGSKVIAEYDNGAAVGSPSREYVYSGAALLAKIDSSGTKYYHQDHLSNRLVTDSGGNTITQMGHFPFGEQWYNTTSDKLMFTSYERDSESGNDYAMARYYINRLGRFSSADPLLGAIAIPQSLNRYAYALNEPINLVDPLGLDSWPRCFETEGAYVCIGLAPGGGSGTQAPLPLVNSGEGGGGGGPKVNPKILNLCTKSLYGITSLGLTLSHEGNGKLGSATDGHYSGVNNPLSPGSLFFDVKNDANNGSFSGGTQGYVNSNNPYVTYTNPYLTQPFLAATQVTELGNALDLISGTQTPDQAAAQDAQPTRTPNPLMHNRNSPPGIDLLNCLMAHGGFSY
jgi:RHS repeat-associated protein